MHHNIARHPGPLGDATLAPTKGITGFVYRSVRGVTHVAGGAVDRVLAPLVPLLARASPWPGREPLVCALNGVLGDRLEATGNPLAIAMQLRHQCKALPMKPAALALAIPGARPRVLVMVHGLCMSDSSWNRNGHDHGECLARDLDADVIYLRYNTGRHISTNGAEFALQLEQLVAAWPVPVRELVLVGHSMGGLVSSQRVPRGRDGATRLAAPAASRSCSSVRRTRRADGARRSRAGRLFGASPYTVAFSRLANYAAPASPTCGMVRGATRIGAIAIALRTAATCSTCVAVAAEVRAFAVAGSASRRPGRRQPATTRRRTRARCHSPRHPRRRDRGLHIPA